MSRGEIAGRKGAVNSVPGSKHSVASAAERPAQSLSDVRHTGQDMRPIESDRHETEYGLELQKPSRNLDWFEPAYLGLLGCEAIRW